MTEPNSREPAPLPYAGLIDDARLVPNEPRHRELGFLPQLDGMGDAALVPLDEAETDAYESGP